MFTQGLHVEYLYFKFPNYAFFLLGCNAIHTKIKNFQGCLDILMELREMLRMLAEKKIELSAEEMVALKQEQEAVSFKNCYSLLSLVKQRLQYILRTLVKLCMHKPPANKDCPRLAQLYKACYVTSFVLTDGLDFDILVSKLFDVLCDINHKLKEFESST